MSDAKKPAPVIPTTHVLVPKHLTPAMREVLAADDWQWEDLLAAANAITLDEYDEIAAGAKSAA